MAINDNLLNDTLTINDTLRDGPLETINDNLLRARLSVNGDNGGDTGNTGYSPNPVLVSFDPPYEIVVGTTKQIAIVGYAMDGYASASLTTVSGNGVGTATIVSATFTEMVVEYTVDNEVSEYNMVFTTHGGTESTHANALRAVATPQIFIPGSPDYAFSNVSPPELEISPGRFLTTPASTVFLQGGVLPVIPANQDFALYFDNTEFGSSTVLRVVVSNIDGGFRTAAKNHGQISAMITHWDDRKVQFFSNDALIDGDVTRAFDETWIIRRVGSVYTMHADNPNNPAVSPAHDVGTSDAVYLSISAGNNTAHEVRSLRVEYL